MQLSLRVSSQFGHISAFIELLRDLYRAKTVNVSSRHLPTTGIEPVFCRLQRLVLTTITTLAWRADLDSNERIMLSRLADNAAEAYVEIENADLRKRLAAAENAASPDRQR